MTYYRTQQRHARRSETFGAREYQKNNQWEMPEVKKSGTVYTKMKKGKNVGLFCVNAWRKTKVGLITATAMPVDGVIHTSDKGNEAMRYVVNIIDQNSGTTQTYWCLMNVKTQMIFIKELGLMLSPNGSGFTSSGKRVSGYFGRSYKSRNSR